ncbi:MAG: carbohydrate binding domain-containing protein [Acidobacteriia bacterium]|nr:carbohydrate binding domain-containing protein [Terriglobia bacterium]
MESASHRTRFLAAGIAVIALFVAWVAGDYAAKVLAGSLRPERVALAARLDPLNAAYHHILGRISFYDRQDFPAALEHYRTATRLNRYSARYWLDLANTQQIMAQPEDSRKSLENALASDPTNPQIASEAANYYLVLGDTPRALNLLGMTVRYSPEDARSAIELSWRATQDANVVTDQVLPHTPEAYLMFLQLLMERRQTDATAQVWQALMELKQSVSPEATFPYIQYLLDEGEVGRARAAWDQLMRRDEALRGYIAAGNLVSNGGFEEDILNGGFSWRYQSDPHVALAIDQREAYQGRRSLAIAFDGEAVQDAGIYQLIVVEPNSEYRVGARVKTEGMEGAGGPQLAVIDRYSRKQFYLSAEFTGTTAWREVGGEFRTEADTKLLMLRIVRVPGTTRVRGRMWLDEVSVVRK